MGGQTALNCALDLDKHGVLEEFGCELIGATADAIDKAENRERFDQAMKTSALNVRVQKLRTAWTKPTMF